MIKKNPCSFFAIVLIAAVMSGCSTYQHTYRLSQIPDKNLSVSDNYVADLDIDFNKKVNAVSRKHKTVQDAKDEAYYLAITQNNIHVVVDPIFSVKTTKIFSTKSVATLTGFAGYYKNARSIHDDNKKRQDEEFAAYDKKVEALKKLAEIPDLASEEERSFAIDSRGGCCGKSGEASTSGSDFGQLHLLHTTINKPSLIDKFYRLYSCDKPCEYHQPESTDCDTKTKKKDTNTESSKSEPAAAKQGLIKKRISKKT